MTNLIFSEQGWDDYIYWKTNDKATIRKINELIKTNYKKSIEK